MRDLGLVLKDPSQPILDHRSQGAPRVPGVALGLGKQRVGDLDSRLHAPILPIYAGIGLFRDGDCCVKASPLPRTPRLRVRSPSVAGSIISRAHAETRGRGVGRIP